jgi:dTMP kinase
MKYKVSFSIDFKRNKHKGKFIAIEGIDGSGKTIQTEKVVKLLRKKGYKKVISTKEPTDRVIGKFIKEDILSGKIKLPPVAIQYIFSADRSDHQIEIENYLKKGYIVVTDRYFWSAVCYGIADLDQVADYYLTVLSVLSPYNRFITSDATFFLNIPIKSALQRIGKSTKHNEIYDNEKKLIKIKKAYDFLIKRFPKEFIVVDGDKDVDLVTEDLVKRIEKKLK